MVNQLIRSTMKTTKPSTKTKTKPSIKNKLSVELVAENKSRPSLEHIENDVPDVVLSMFDYNIENHLRAIDMIVTLCQVPANNDMDKSEMERLSSTITFLRVWRDFNHKPRVLRFADESGTSQGKNAPGDIHLPQFSAATVPKGELQSNVSYPGLSKDFVFYVGGPVWALDWCPRVPERSDCHVKCEFIAVSAHPPGSSYHRLGVPVTGRGFIQIWCVINVIENKDYVIPEKTSFVANNSSLSKEDHRGRPRKIPIKESPDKIPKECRGRLRKNPVQESLNQLDSNDKVRPVVSLNSEDMVIDSTCDGAFTTTHEIDSSYNGKRSKSFCRGISARNSSQNKNLSGNGKKRKGNDNGDDDIRLHFLRETEICGSSSVNSQINNSSEHDHSTSNNLLPTNEFLVNGLASNSIPEVVASPRMILCLAHYGKVAWDAKWRPTCVNDIDCPYRMGYLAVILGNGSLEVWDVPLPSTVGVLFSSLPKEGTDPRFVKLNPVFRCSKVKRGDMQSIPLTVEWSSSSPGDFILAGCHDGTVALWKFSASDICQDTKPLLCFSADTAPIRALAWAPAENDPESANVIVTAGHGSLKFWDIRDPFRPIWDLSSLREVIYSLDWLPDPRCLILCIDDGTMKILCLNEASYDVPVTGKPFNGTKLKGLHTYQCSEFPIWSIQASHQTGMVAFCTSDGNVHRFQLTTNVVEKHHSRNRPPTFLCTSVVEEKSIVTIKTPVLDTPLQMKKSFNGSGAGASATSMRQVMIDLKKGRMNDSDIKGLCQTSDERPLDLCYGNDFEADHSKAETPLQKGDKRTLKSIPFGKGTAKFDKTNLTCLDKEKISVDKTQFEAMPSKIVAMHRVRWNHNKGSERWLCYGGAAGIVRCQQIVFS